MEGAGYGRRTGRVYAQDQQSIAHMTVADRYRYLVAAPLWAVAGKASETPPS